MSNPWQQVFESHREQIEENYVAEKYGQHKSDESQETQALYDLRNKMKNMGKDAVVAYLKRSKMAPERKARLAKALGISIAEEYVDESAVANLVRLGLAAGTAAAGGAVIKKAKQTADKINATNKEKERQINRILGKESIEIDADDIQEKAPPGAKYERMVKHIKKRYSKGGLTDKEKSIAYATAWKAKNQNEELEYIEEESKILVRVTKEDGSIFQKKIPASQLADYRKRYKTVVVVGGSEQSQTGVSAKTEEYVNEAEKPKRWWDDDGDGIGYEKGEVSGKFKRKKKTRKEEYSDWRSEFPELAEATKAQKSVEGKANASYETEKGEKKKRKKESDESECDCSHEMKESAEILAQELGGELVNISENVGKVFSAGLKAATKVIPKLKIGTEPAGKLAVRTTSTAITKAKPAAKPAVQKALSALEKAEIERLQSSSIKDSLNRTVTLSTGRKVNLATATQTQTKTATKTQTKPQTKTGTVVKLDNKTGAISKVLDHPSLAPQTQTKTQPKKPGGGGVIAPPTTPPKGPGGTVGGGGGGPIPLPKPKIKPYLKDPVQDPGTLKL